MSGPAPVNGETPVATDRSAWRTYWIEFFDAGTGELLWIISGEIPPK